MPANPLAPWKEKFTILPSAEREFLKLKVNIQVEFLQAFPEFVEHPWTQTATLDVAPLREMPGRWRLKVPGGHRGIYRPLHALPEFEMFQSRDQVYENLRKFLSSRK